VGLKIEYRLVNSAPVYTRENGIMTISSHVQTHVYAPAQTNNKYDFFFSKVIIDYFPSKGGMFGGVVDDADFVSMYYQNLAAKALLVRILIRHILCYPWPCSYQSITLKR